MGIAWFRWLIVRGRVAVPRLQPVFRPCLVRVCAEWLSVASPYLSVVCPLGSPFSVRDPSVKCSGQDRYLSVGCPSEARWLCAIIPL